MSEELPKFPGGDEEGGPYLTARELANRWQVNRETIYRFSSTALPYLKLGSRTKRYRRKDVRAFEERNLVRPST